MQADGISDTEPEPKDEVELTVDCSSALNSAAQNRAKLILVYVSHTGEDIHGAWVVARDFRFAAECWATGCPMDNRSPGKVQGLLEFTKWFQARAQEQRMSVELFFWIDYCCLLPTEAFAAIPLFIATCTEILVWRTPQFDRKVWPLTEACHYGRFLLQVRRYFVRSGLVRKDRLCSFVPSGFHPATVVVRNFTELLSGLVQLGSSQLEVASKKAAVKYDPWSHLVLFEGLRISEVLKKAQSSNAHGIRFLTDVEATQLLQIQERRRRAKWSLAWILVAAPLALALAKLRRATAKVAILVPMLAATAWRFSSRCRWPVEWATHELAGEGSALYVLQRNVEPWLHCGRKFHLRVLLLCVGDLTAYVHKDVRVLLASGRYTDGCGDSGRLDVHVTNMGVNKAVSDYSETEQNIALQELGEELATKIFGELSDVLAKTLTGLQAAGRRHFFTLPNCWELFGADFLVEAGTARAVLLEINPSPSLAMYSADLHTLLGEASGLLLLQRRPHAVCCGCVWIRCEGHMEAGDGIFDYVDHPLWDDYIRSVTPKDGIAN
eukprot:s112_g20.t2